MNKLTAEKAKQIIAGLKENAAYAGPSIRDEYMMQALEIALPVLEQQEKGNDGWIEWGGGKCPVNINSLVNVRYRNGGEDLESRPAVVYNWSHNDKDCYPIIAYRVIENDGREG